MTCAMLLLWASVSLSSDPQAKGCLLLVDHSIDRGAGRGLRWSFDDNYLYYSGISSGGTLARVQRRSAADVAIEPQATLDESDAVMTSDGRTILASDRRSIFIRTVPTLAETATIRLAGRLLAVSSSGDICAIANPPRCEVVRVADARVLSVLDLKSSAATNGHFLLNNSVLVCITGVNNPIPDLGSASVMYSNISCEPVVFAALPRLPARPSVVSTSDRGTLFAVAYPASEVNPAVAVVDAASGKLRREIGRANSKHNGIAFSHDGGLIGVCGTLNDDDKSDSAGSRRQTGHIAMYDTRSWSQIVDVRQEGSAFISMAIAHEQKCFAAIDDLGVLRIWRYESKDNK